MKKSLQNFGNIIFTICYIICNLAVNFVNVRQNTPCTVWSPFSGLLTALVLLSSVARWCKFACLFVWKFSCRTIEKLVYFGVFSSVSTPFWMVKFCWILCAKWNIWKINFICVFVFALATLNSSDEVENIMFETETSSKKTRLQNLWILPQFFNKMSSSLPKFNFVRISGIFPGCFHCLLTVNTTEKQLVEIQTFY